MISVMNNDYELDRKSDVSAGAPSFKVESSPESSGIMNCIDGSTGVSSVVGCDGTEGISTTTGSVETGTTSSSELLFTEEELEKKVEIRVSDNLQQLDSRNSDPDVGNVKPEVMVSLEEVDSREMDDKLEFRLSEVEPEEVEKKTTGNSELEQLTMKEERGKFYFGQRKGNIEVMEEQSLLDFNSAYSRVDEGTAARMSEAFGSEAAKALKYGFEPGDMVWGKVKSHPWWPGQIFNGSLASTSVRHSKREGHLLVAFFGDNSYGWFDPAELIPFEPHYLEKSQQTNSRTFMKAVEDAVDEAQRRAALGLTCYCRNPFNFRPTSVQGYFAVDVGGYEPGFLYTVTQIKKARDNFQPVEALSFVLQLATEPRNNDQKDIDHLKNVSMFLAYRKATFEEFDETYAQAFGSQPVLSTYDSMGIMDRPAKFSSRAPLSGPLVFAEALGEVKSSTKLSKVKDQSKKDKYLLKRRDTMNEPNAQHFSQVHAGSVTSPGYKEVAAATMSGDFVLQKRTPAASISMEPHDHKEQKGIRTISREDAGSISSETKLDMVETQVNTKRFYLPDGSPIDFPMIAYNNSSTVQGGLEDGKLHLDKKMNDLHGMNGNVTPVGGIDFGNIDLELPQLLSDLLTLALDPFHGVERNSPAIVRHALLQFRSLVYQKSLVLAPQSEAQTAELCNRRSSAGENPIPKKLPKPLARPDDPTKAGRKRSSSDRQEEMSAKRVKKVKELKSLTNEKKAGSQKILEQKPGEQKEAGVSVPTKLTKAEILKKQREQKEAGLTVPSKLIKPNTVKKSEPLVRVAEPTMLVMMFPPRTTLPSVPELKAKFARFGPLDPSAFRVFWKSSTCRVVFKYKSHAQTAYRFAIQNKGFFGQVKVNYQLRDVANPAPEVPESAKRRADDHASDGFQSFRPGLGNDSVSGELRRPQQPAVQLKSCLKKPSGEETAEAAMGGTRENARVKFVLDGEGSSRREQLMVSSSRNQTKNNNIGSSSESDVCASPSTVEMDVNSKKFQKVFPPLPLPPLLAHPPRNLDMHENRGIGHFPNPSTHSNYTQIVEEQQNNNRYTNISSNSNSIDFSSKFLSLLLRCNDIVTDVRSSLGHVSYQPL